MRKGVKPEVVLHPEAEIEYREAIRWYANCGQKIAAAFEAEIDRSLRLIRQSPERWPRYEGKSHRIIVRRFPYSVIYYPSRKIVWVIAIAHDKRKPGYWRHRVLPGI